MVKTKLLEDSVTLDSLTLETIFIIKHSVVILTACSETCAYVLCLLSQGEEEFDMPQPPHGHVLHRHMRTIREVRTLVTRVITDVYYVDGTEVERKVTEVIYTLSLCGKLIPSFLPPSFLPSVSLCHLD